MRDDRPTKFEGPRYLGDATIVVIPPGGPDRDELVEWMVAAAEQYFDRDPDIHHAVVVERMVIAALKALIGEK